VWKSKTPRTLKARKLLILGSSITRKKRKISQLRYVCAARIFLSESYFGVGAWMY
jgi:hypothetical protein